MGSTRYKTIPVFLEILLPQSLFVFLGMGSPNLESPRCWMFWRWLESFFWSCGWKHVPNSAGSVCFCSESGVACEAHAFTNQQQKPQGYVLGWEA